MLFIMGLAGLAVPRKVGAHTMPLVIPAIFSVAISSIPVRVAIKEIKLNVLLKLHPEDKAGIRKQI